MGAAKDATKPAPDLEMQGRKSALGRLTGDDSRRVQVTWEDLSYTVSLNKSAQKAAGGAKTKKILDGMNGHAAPASMLAIMGSSGSGKTTALKMLSFRTDHPGELAGRLKVNGQELSSADKKSFSRKVAYVMQDDLVLETQTPRETIAFSASLRLPTSVSSKERRELVNAIIEVLKLERCADTLIGNSATGGISGGERKRVSIGCEMVTNPAVILLDEPTSGLDAYTALSVMTTLNEIAHAGRTIITTIHQPASEIFDTFHSLLLLHQGRDAYFGPAANALAHFEQLGVVCPPQHNPADFLINCLMRQKYNEGDPLPDFTACWVDAEHRKQGLQLTSLNTELEPFDPGKSQGTPGQLVQFFYIGKRNLVTYMRNKIGFRARTGQTLFFSLLLGCVFYNLGRDASGLQDRQGLLFFVNINMFFTGLLSVVLIFPQERRLFEREFASGYYGVTSYYMAKVWSEFPFGVFFPLIYSAILYFMAGLQASAAAFWTFALIMILLTQVAASLGFFIGCIVPTPELAVTIAPVLIIPFMITAGLLASKERLDPYFIWLEKVSPFSYAYEALIITEFSGLQFNYTDTLTVFSCDALGNAASKEQTQQVSVSGESVIARLGMADGDVGFNVAVLVILFMGMRILSLIALQLRAYGLSKILRRG